MRAPAPSMRPMTTTPAAAAALPWASTLGPPTPSLGLAAADGAVRLAGCPGRGGDATTTWRTILYFEPGRDGARGRARDRALRRDRGRGAPGAVDQDHLASAVFSGTQDLGKS